jgi:hypothetical protein
VRITLAVHPRYGEEAQVLRGYGPDAVWLEWQDGQITIVPKSWTSLVPRPGPLRVRGRPVRLSPDVAKTLALWVEARRLERRAPSRRKVAAAIIPTDKVENGQPQRPEGSDRAAAPVVEQAGAPGHCRRSGRGGGHR